MTGHSIFVELNIINNNILIESIGAMEDTTSLSIQINTLIKRQSILLVLLTLTRIIL